MSNNLDLHKYAGKILNMTRNMAGNYSYPLPVKRIRALCNAVLNKEQEADKRPPLTDVEQAVLTAVKADVAQGINPTVRSVQNRLDYKSSNSAKVVIDRLIKHGYLTREGSRKQIVVVSLRK